MKETEIPVFYSEMCFYDCIPFSSPNTSLDTEFFLLQGSSVLILSNVVTKGTLAIM